MRVRSYRDPIYGYIDFTSSGGPPDPLDTKFEADLIASDYVQRLHQIAQLHTAWVRYPSATHSRFSHSLGVMHLAGEFVREIYTDFVHKVTKSKMPDLDNLPNIEAVVEVFRIAGLLHDCGHGPFSHIFEDAVLKPRFKITHEEIGARIASELLGGIIEKIRHSPRGAFEETIPSDLVSYLISPRNSKSSVQHAKLVSSDALSRICCQLDWLLSWRFANADTLDYLMRDAYHCGTPEYQGADATRLMRAIVLEPGENGSLEVVLDAENAETAIVSYLSSRMYMFQAVYFHEDVRAREFELEKLLALSADLINLKNPLSDWEALRSYCRLTDTSISPSVLDGVTTTLKQKNQIRKLHENWRHYRSEKNEKSNRWHKLLDLISTAALGNADLTPKLAKLVIDESVGFLEKHTSTVAAIRLDLQRRRILPTIGSPVPGKQLRNSRKITVSICRQLPRHIAISRLYINEVLPDKIRSALKRHLKVHFMRELKNLQIDFQ